MKRRQLISVEDAAVATRQHTKPCSDCPFARAALPGWLGGLSADEWIALAHGEGTAECHALLGVDCAGLAMYRANVCKRPRDPHALRLPADRQRVFANSIEFLQHHQRVAMLTPTVPRVAAREMMATVRGVVQTRK